ncbi:hypothetical protein TNCV_2050981 [Trichonephila clavipes]|nr:hypothetical protein TNCV_2050981 [Trichonephila clavipes]
MEKGLENVQKCQDLRNTLEKKTDGVIGEIALKIEEKVAIVEEKVAVVEEKIEKKVEHVEEKYEEVAGNFNFMSQRVEDHEKKLLASENATNENKLVPVS